MLVLDKKYVNVLSIENVCRMASIIEYQKGVEMYDIKENKRSCSDYQRNCYHHFYCGGDNHISSF